MLFSTRDIIKAWYTLVTKLTVGKTGNKSVADIFDFVADLSEVDCRKWVIFVAQMSNVLSTLLPCCQCVRGQSDTADCVESDFIASVYRT